MKHRKRQRRLMALLVIAVALMLADRFVRPAVFQLFSPVHDAQWIWAPGLERHTVPLAFYAVRDFELVESPTKAELSIQADAEYILLVNGQRVGSGRYYAGAALDRYEISKFLRSGRNRLAVKLRTPRGIGGLLCHLEIDDDPRKRIVSDNRWIIQRRHQPRLTRGGELLSTAHNAKSWALPPTGRWGWPKLGTLRPDLTKVILGKRALPASLVSRGADSAEWERSPRPREKPEPLGSWVTFDWKKPVHGYVKLGLAEREFKGALLFVGRERPDPSRDEPVNFVISIPGSRSWVDSQPRSFRYVTVVGVSELTGAELWRIDPTQVIETQARDAAQEGVYGLQGPNLRTPMENEIWRQIHRLAGE